MSAVDSPYDPFTLVASGQDMTYPHFEFYSPMSCQRAKITGSIFNINNCQFSILGLTPRYLYEDIEVIRFSLLLDIYFHQTIKMFFSNLCNGIPYFFCKFRMFLHKLMTEHKIIGLCCKWRTHFYNVAFKLLT